MNPDNSNQNNSSNQKKPNIASSAVNQSVQTGLNKATMAASKMANLAATSAAAATAILAPIAPLIGQIAGYITKIVGSKVATFVNNHKGQLAVGLGLGLGVPALAAIGGIGIIPGFMAVGGALMLVMMAKDRKAMITGLLITMFVIFGSITLFTAFAMFIINSGAYIVPKGESIPGYISPDAVITKKESQYIDVTKRVDKTGPFENTDLPLKLHYTVTVRAKLGPLTNIKFDNVCQATRRNAAAPGAGAPGTSNINCPAPIPDSIPTEIAAGDTYTFEYDVEYSASDYKDSFVVDTFSTQATSAGKTTTATAAVGIKIGDPPEDCPSGWPIVTAPNERLYISQGVNTGISHVGYQAIDISASTGHQIRATHSGTAITDIATYWYGRQIRILSICAGKSFISLYAHLSAIGVQNGQRVVAGQIIGLSGGLKEDPYSGRSEGPHLHYEFQPPIPEGVLPRDHSPANAAPIPMAPPFVPRNFGNIP